VPFQLLLILGLAELSYRWIETPLGAKPWVTRSIRSLLIGFGINAAVAALLLLLISGELGSSLYAGQRPATLSEQRQKQRIAGTSITSSDCLVNRKAQPKTNQIGALSAPARLPPETTQGAPSSWSETATPAALIPLAADLHQQGLGITLLAKAGCPFPATAPRPSRPWLCPLPAKKLPRGFLPRPGPATPC